MKENFNSTEKYMFLGLLVVVLLSAFFLLSDSEENDIQINYAEFREAEEDADFAFSLTSRNTDDLTCAFVLSYLENTTMRNSSFSVNISSFDTVEGIHNMYLPDGDNNVSIRYECSISVLD